MPRKLQALLLCLLLWLALPPIMLGQNTHVTAEAIGQANLRAATNTDSDLLGQIAAGTRYPVIGRSQFYPWLLLGDPASLRPMGWVFAELVTVQGNLNSVAFTEIIVDGSTVVLKTPTAQPSTSPGTTPIPTSTATTGVIGTVSNEINVRYGPGVEYPRVGVGRAGDQFEILARHTQFPWLQVRFAEAPNGVGWVATDLLAIQGNVFNLPAITQTFFDLPTLTPTASALQLSALFQSTPVAISPQFQALADQLWNMTLTAGFDSETSRLAALFLLDLRTQEAITFDNQIAFSGMSLNKIVILATLYSVLQSPPNLELAIDIANMMVCSENSASNAILSYLGDGDPLKGGAVITEFMQRLGLDNTYIVAPFKVSDNATPAPVRAPTTSADQIRTQPDVSNQMTVDNLGWLLGGIYQCAIQNSGPLTTAMPGAFDNRECRQMINVMSDNNLGQPLLMSAGVPANTRVAHKHGWIPDTHGNAGIVFTPGGDYVFVVALHNPTWLDFSESFPLITELSQTIYNYYNPVAPITAPRDPFIVEVQDCQIAGTPIVDALMSYES